MFTLSQIEAMKAAKEEALLTTLVVDTAITLKKGDIADIAEPLMEIIEARCYKLASEYIVPGLPESKITGALYQIRKTTKAQAVLVITNLLVDASNTINLYLENNQVYVYIKDCDQYLTANEYTADISKEICLDQILKARQDPNREYLEELAKVFAPCLGWNFSGPISASAPDPTLFGAMQPHKVKPYNGFKMNLTRFDTGVRVFKDEYIEDTEKDTPTTIKMSNKTKLLRTQGVPTSELIEFETYYNAISHKLKHYLEPDWVICQCGYPTKTVGTLDNATCQYCNTEIPDFYCQDLGMDYKTYKLYQEAEKYKHKGKAYILKLLKEIK